jgi:hypothetical protein
MLGIFNSAKRASDQMVLATIGFVVDRRNERSVSSGCWHWEDCWFEERKGVEAAGGSEVEAAQSESGVLTERGQMKRSKASNFSLESKHAQKENQVLPRRITSRRRSNRPHQTLFVPFTLLLLSHSYCDSCQQDHFQH